MSEMGFVSLVGAGPGVKDHLTLRALDRLKRADLVLYDALVDPSILDLAQSAHRFFVGKRAGRHAMSQSTIEALLIRHAREGRRVVRLKAGDPFVLGRGGEEAIALEEAGVPYEVVPGISSALAAPTFGGIPVTHRGLSAACTIVSGHSEESYRPILNSLAPGCSTLVVLMGYRNRASIGAQLRERGWSADTPVSMIAGAGTREQRIWKGDIQDLTSTLDCAFDPSGAPVTMVFGAAVALSDVIRKPPPADSGEDDEPTSQQWEIGNMQP